MRLLAVCFIMGLVSLSLAGAEVFWFEVEKEYDEEKSNLTFNEKGLNVAWDIGVDKDAFNEQYMTPRGANRDSQQAAAGLVYIIPEVDNINGWQLWIRCMMPTTGSDSFFYQISEDGGEDWGMPIAAHGAMQFEEWTWHRPWNIGTLRRGEDNAIRIAERENNAKLDVICLRNDGQVPTDEEYEDYLKQPGKKEKLVVNAVGKAVSFWGRVKSDGELEH